MRIKEIRKKNGDTLKELAAKINYDYSNLSKIERGIYSPSISLLKKIAGVYGVDFVHLLDETEKLTTAEERLMYDLDLSSEELLKKYTLLLDGQKLTEEEIDFIINTLRILRDAVQKK